jgi:hypothetical protein
MYLQYKGRGRIEIAREGGRPYISTVGSQPLLIDTNTGVKFAVMWQH